MMNHAPGPWTIGETDTRIAIKSGKRTIAYVQMARDDYENSNLIAAAPDLLDLARNIAGGNDWFERSADIHLMRAVFREFLMQAHDAIDKVRGEVAGVQPTRRS